MGKQTYLIVCVTVSLYLGSTIWAADGFGQYTTGGAGGAVVPAATAQQFMNYVQTPLTPLIIEVTGTIELSGADNGRVRIESNKTIRGVQGTNPTIIGSLGFKKSCSNVIIERLTITCPQNYTSEEDAISVKEIITNVFINKCTIYDSWDGCIDVARKSDWVTISWCKFYFTSRNANNDRVCLIGNTDSSGDEGTLHVTFHHNWFGAMCMQRIPSVRYGRAHIYNNYYNCPGNIYCIWSRLHAECLIENNYFKDVDNPYYNIDYDDTVKGKIGAWGNILDNCTGTVHPGTDTVFTPPYAYTPDSAAMTPAIVQWGAGADGKDGLPPHWQFGVYGDFDYSGLVDMKDFAQFSHYWQATSGITDADYNGDGVVDITEFGLLAQNWMKIKPDTTAPAVPANVSAEGGNASITIHWDDNGEEDLDGYNLYRSTTSGTGYIKLNNSLLSVSSYTDTDVINETAYYYVLTAVDKTSNESDFSAQVSAIPVGPDTLIVQEETAGYCWIDGFVDKSGKNPGYTGTGFLDTTNAVGSGINWSIRAGAAGSYTLTWRYANGSTDRPGRLLVNGLEVFSSISFPATGAWTNYLMTAPATVILPAGVSSVRLEATTASGCANIDYLKVTGDLPEPAACP